MRVLLLHHHKARGRCLVHHRGVHSHIWVLDYHRIACWRTIRLVLVRLRKPYTVPIGFIHAFSSVLRVCTIFCLGTVWFVQTDTSVSIRLNIGHVRPYLQVVRVVFFVMVVNVIMLFAVFAFATQHSEYIATVDSTSSAHNA
jgi:hypothetical protein